ncbi:MAG TPA: hypothetical protein VLT51_01025, partial [Anaerolineales bacterium]|nr:hypothetical protein [Anaerolineales bacterium]
LFNFPGGIQQEQSCRNGNNRADNMRKDWPTIHQQHKTKQAADNDQGDSSDFSSHLLLLFMSVLFFVGRTNRKNPDNWKNQ